MALQTKINGRQVRGIVGEFSDDSPKSARQYIVFGKDDNSKPTFGKFFSIYGKALNPATSSEKTVVAKQGVGEDSWSMGVLVNPKEHFTHGFVTTLEMDAGTAGTVALRGHIWVDAATTVVAGEPVYVDADGNLGSEDLANGTKVLGAKWLTSREFVENVVNLAEIAIDNPVLDGESGPGSL